MYYEEPDFLRVGLAIKMFRSSKSITQIELANQIGVSQTHMSNIEHGRVAINLRLLIKLANIFNCKLDDFFNPPDILGDTEKQPEYDEEDVVVILKMLQLLGRKK